MNEPDARIEAAMQAFMMSPTYGAAFDFAEYSIRDVILFMTKFWNYHRNNEIALLDYILPQGISRYLTMSPVAGMMDVINRYSHKICHDLPSYDKLTLLFLLDLLATLCSRAEWDTRTWRYLAKIFAPLIMQPHEEREDLVVFLIQYHRSLTPPNYQDLHLDGEWKFLELDQEPPRKTPIRISCFGPLEDDGWPLHDDVSRKSLTIENVLAELPGGDEILVA